MQSHDITYERDTVCLSCWASNKTNPLLQKELIVNLQGSKETQESKEKKISLRKGPKNKPQQTERMLHSLRRQENRSLCPLTPRVQTQSDNQGLDRRHSQPSIISYRQSEPTRLITHQMVVHRFIREIPQHHHQQHYKIIQNVNRSALTGSLNQTTKMPKLQQQPQMQLDKTRKNMYAGKEEITNLMDFKTSICSINEEEKEVRERLQQSQIVLDFFNPGEVKLKQIQSMINNGVIREQDSFVLQ